MHVSNGTLGTVAMVMSPLMMAEYLLKKANHLPGGQFGIADGIIGLLYLAGFAATLVGLRRLRVTGQGAGAAVLFGFQVSLLAVAALQQVLELANASTESSVFGLADAAWPLSHTLMCVTAVAMIVARKWRGYRVVLPFLCGFSVPVLLAVQAVAGKDAGIVTFALLTTASFALLGYAIRSSYERETPAIAYVKQPVLAFSKRR